MFVPRGCRTRIAVVDPRPSEYRPLFARLRSAEVDYASSGEEALRQTRFSRASLWMVAAELPDMNGIELCRALRPRVRVPLLLVAEEYGPQLELDVLSTGGVQLACKPLCREYLCEMLRSIAAPYAGAAA